MSYEVEFTDVFCYEEEKGKHIDRERISVTVKREDDKTIKVSLYAHNVIGSLHSLPSDAWEELKVFVDSLVEEAKRWRPMSFRKE